MGLKTVVGLIMMSVMYVVVPFLDSTGSVGIAATSDPLADSLWIDNKYGDIPIYFTPNEGQVDKRVLFYAKGKEYALWLTGEGLVFDVSKGVRGRHVTGLVFLDANKEVHIQQLEPAGHRVNYFKGNDPLKWKKGIETSRTVFYKNLYNNIDLKVYGAGRLVEYDLVVRPGGKVEDITLQYTNVTDTRIDEEGNLVVDAEVGRLVHKRPVAYQEKKGKPEVRVAFEQRGKNTYGFKAEKHNPDDSLTIDPLVLGYSTYLGGQADDFGTAIAVDNKGNAYITGETVSDFPVSGGYDSTPNGGADIFVTKITKDGTGLSYSTYFGGQDAEGGLAIAVDSQKNAYVTGFTDSCWGDFPLLKPFDEFENLVRAGFVAKFDPGGGLLYSSPIAGQGGVWGTGIAVDGAGAAYVFGQTYNAEDFPLKNPLYDTGGMFVTKVAHGGGVLVYSTLFGGSAAYNTPGGIAVDKEGSAYITGTTENGSIPTVAGSYDVTYNGGIGDAFITKINPKGTALIYSTFLGGSSSEHGNAIGVDDQGAAYVTGSTRSKDFPLKNFFQGASWYTPNFDDIFITKIDPGGKALQYSTLLGGNSYDYGYSIAVGSDGAAYVTGRTFSSNFPVKKAVDDTYGGSNDVFVSKLYPWGSTLAYSTYLGGSGIDQGKGIAVDGTGSALVVGHTGSADFPTTPNSLDITNPYGFDVFVTRLDFTDSIAKPSNLAARAISPTEVLLSWKDNSDNEAGFNIYRKEGSCSSIDPWELIRTVERNVVSYTNKGLGASAKYSYRIRGYNGKLQSGYSACMAVTTGSAGTPKAPLNLKATSISPSKVRLTWKDNSGDETSFKIFRKVGNGAWKLLSSAPANAVTTLDSTANGNESSFAQSYYLKACNQSGCSPAGNTAAVPFKPTELDVSVRSGVAYLTWKDNSINETGFEIYRKEGNCSSANPWTLLHQTGPDVESYDYLIIDLGKTYSYRLRSCTRSSAQPYSYGYSGYSTCKP